MRQYDPHLDPELQWAGKSERMSFEAKKGDFQNAEITKLFNKYVLLYPAYKLS